MASANDIAILHARITMPRVGVWHADVSIDSEEALTGTVTLDDEGELFVGTVRRSGVFAARTISRIVGGAGALGTELASKNYQSVALRVPLDDILTETGETLDATAAMVGQTFTVSHWHRRSGPAGMALHEIAAKLGLDWRILANGKLWMGTDTFPEQDIEHTLISVDPGLDTFTVAPDKSDLRPGVTFREERIGRVEHRIEPEGVRTQAWIEGTLKPLSGPLDRYIRQIERRDIYRGRYPATVVSQASNGRLELLPDDATIRGTGTDAVPMLHGFPGATVELNNANRVLLGFRDADPASPYVAGWEPGSGKMKIGTLLVAQNATSFALLPPQFFNAGATGDAAAVAAAALITGAGNSAFLIAIETSIVAD